MSGTRLWAGILGVLSVLTFAVTTAISITGFKDGIFSPFYCFVTELGSYSKTGVSSPLIFNIGLIASGIFFCAFMILLGIQKERSIYTAVCFSGTLSGMLLIAQGIFTINYAIHVFFLIDYFASVFITCIILVIAEMLFNKNRERVLNSAVASLTGLASILSAGFVFTNGMGQFFSADKLGTVRPGLIPFAVIGWAAYILFFLLLFLLSFEMFTESGDEPERITVKNTDDDFITSKKANVKNIRDIEL
jgi:hypothetical membrane protein